MKQVDVLLKETGIIPVLKIEDAEKAVPMAEALRRGGIYAAEVTFRTAAAPQAIAAISTALPDMFVCAGTILTPQQAQEAVASGAKAIISPGTNPEVVGWCTERDIPVYPGCATPTEVEAALRMGLTTLKLFPAEVVGGVSMLKALYGPYAQVTFMPTGGISPENVGDYLRLPNVIACGGSWICPEKLLSEERYEEIEALAREAAQLVRRLRTP